MILHDLLDLFCPKNSNARLKLCFNLSLTSFQVGRVLKQKLFPANLILQIVQKFVLYLVKLRSKFFDSDTNVWWKPQQMCLRSYISISCISIVVAAAVCELDRDGAPSVLTSRRCRPFKVSKCHRERDHFPPETLTAGRGQSDSTAALAEVSANQPIRRSGACLGGRSRSVCCHFMIWLLVSNLLSLLEHEAHHYPVLTRRLTNNRWQDSLFFAVKPCFFLTM